MIENQFSPEKVILQIPITSGAIYFVEWQMNIALGVLGLIQQSNLSTLTCVIPTLYI